MSICNYFYLVMCSSFSAHQLVHVIYFFCTFTDTVNEERSSALDTLTSVANGSRTWNGFHSQIQDSSSGHRRVLLSTQKSKSREAIFTVPVLPWLNGGGGINSTLFKSLARRVLGIVMLNPGISEVNLLVESYLFL